MSGFDAAVRRHQQAPQTAIGLNLDFFKRQDGPAIWESSCGNAGFFELPEQIAARRAIEQFVHPGKSPAVRKVGAKCVINTAISQRVHARIVFWGCTQGSARR